MPGTIAETIDVLLVEDNPADARLLVESLKDASTIANFRVTTVARMSAALEHLARLTPHVIVVDLTLPDSSGLDSAKRFQEAAPGVPIVVLTGLEDQQLALEAIRKGIQDYLVKGQCEGELAARALRYAVERRRVEAKLLEREERLRTIVNTAVDAIITIDEAGVIESVNPSAERLFGYTSGEIVGSNVSLLMPEPYRREHDAYVRAYVGSGLARVIGIGREVTGLRKDGTTFPLSLAVSEMWLGNRRMFTGFIHDLSRRRQLEREVLETAAAEQRRIGRDLHDGLCQELVSLAMGLELTAQKLARRALGDEAAAVEKMAESLQNVTTQARQMAHGLNPVDVDGGGLPLALQQLAARATESTGIECRFDGDLAIRTASADVATHLYRIAQEAVSNAIKHGRPTRIDVHLSEGNGQLLLRVEDDGRGLPASTALTAPHAEKTEGGMGMRSMNFRAGLIGGILDIRPAKGTGGGTVVACSLNLAADARGTNGKRDKAQPVKRRSAKKSH